MDYGNMTYSEIVDAAEYSEARMHFNNDSRGKAEWTQTLAEQMQVIMEKVSEPAIINATFEVVDNDCITCLSCGIVYELPDPRLCHCGAPLDNAECECEACTAEWNEFLTAAADVRGNLYSL